MRFLSFVPAVTLAAIVTIFSNNIAAVPLYSLEPIIPDDPQNGTTAFAINELGQVVGSVNGGPFGPTGMFLYENGNLNDLGNMPGLQATVATDINDSGVITGWSLDVGSGLSRSFIYSNGSYEDLGALAGGTTRASGINNSDVVVGTSNNEAFIYADGEITSLLGLAGFRRAAAINNNGDVAGRISVNGSFRASVYSNGITDDLGTLGGDGPFLSSAAFDINENGDIAGQSQLEPFNPFRHAVVTTNGEMIDIGSELGDGWSSADAINNNGVAVGLFNPDVGGSRAFVYDGNNSYDLNELIDPTLGWHLGGALDINDSGQIVGNGEFGGLSLGFLLTPIVGSEAANPVFPDDGSISGSTFDFDLLIGELGLGTERPIFIDPIVAIGYDYEVATGDPNFASVLLPDIGDGQYALWFYDDLLDEFVDASIGLSAGSQFFFGGDGVQRFRIMGIEASEMLSPTDPAAFVTGLTFVSPSEGVNVSMSAVELFVPDANHVPLSGTLWMLLIGFASLVAVRKTV